MLNRVVNSINYRPDDGFPSTNKTSDSWSMKGYQYDGSNYNYDAYEVTPFENERAAYLSVCALADYASSIVPSLGQVDVGSVKNVKLDGVNSHKACLSSMGSTIGSTIDRMGTALNARFKAEVENGTLFGGEGIPSDFDYAAYLKGQAFENSSEILGTIKNFGSSGEGIDNYGEDVYDPKTTLSIDWVSLKEENPEAYQKQLEEAYNAARSKDSSEWTLDEAYAACEYYQQLQTQYADAKSRHDTAVNYGGADDEADNEMGKVGKEIKALESQMKSAGILQYTDKEQASMDLANAWKGFTEAIDRKVAAEEAGDEETFREAEKVQFATMAVFTDKVATGVKKIGEDIADSAVKTMGYLATPITKLNDLIFGTDETGKMMDSIRSDVAVDRTGDAEREKYETVQRWIDNNANSTLQYDSAGAKAVSETVEDAGVMVLAAASASNPVTLTGAVVVAGMKGDGEKSEELYNVTDGNGGYVYRNPKGDAIGSASGVKTAVEAYSVGKLAGALGGAGDVKIIADGTKTFTGDALKDAAGNALKNADMYIFEAGNVANSLESGLETGDYKIGELALGTAAIGAGTFAVEYSSAVKAGQQMGATKVEELSDDKLAGVYGGGEKTPVSPKTDPSAFSSEKQAQLAEATKGAETASTTGSKTSTAGIDAKRNELLGKAQESDAKKLVDQLYRPGADIGDGGTADVLRYELETGDLKSPKGHMEKAARAVNKINSILEKNPNHTDKELLLGLADDLIDAMPNEIVPKAMADTTEYKKCLYTYLESRRNLSGLIKEVK